MDPKTLLSIPVALCLLFPARLRVYRQEAPRLLPLAWAALAAAVCLFVALALGGRWPLLLSSGVALVCAEGLLWLHLAIRGGFLSKAVPTAWVRRLLYVPVVLVLGGCALAGLAGALRSLWGAGV
jgi:hypothetical protein